MALSILENIKNEENIYQNEKLGFYQTKILMLMNKFYEADLVL